jgi:hypothetical protein
MAKQELQTAISKRDSDIAAAKQMQDTEIRRVYADPQEILNILSLVQLERLHSLLPSLFIRSTFWQMYFG